MPELDESSWGRERLLESLDAYRRGLSDAPLLRKWNQSEARQVAEPAQEQMTFEVSNDEVDRHGDVIVPGGWQLEAYQRNPVFLWAHDYARPVIGRAVSVWKEPQRLLARMEFAPTDFAQEVATLYRDNYQRGVSVGFRPISYEERRQAKTGAFLGIRFLEQELLEVSAVPVPANRSALRRALEQAPRVGDYLRRVEQSNLRGTGPDVAEGVWPELVARVDDLGKLAEELAEMVGSLECNYGGDRRADEMAKVLAVLRGARW